MSQADSLRSPIATAAQKKYLAEITQLIANAAEIQNLKGRMGVGKRELYARSEDGVLSREEVQDGRFSYAAVEREAIKKAEQFGLKVRRLVRIFHRELPDAALASASVQTVQLFTENEAEGERLMGRFWITDVWDSERADPIERRNGIDLEAIRDATEWLEVLAAKFELGSGQRDAHPGAPKTNELARTKDRVRALRRGGLSFEKICQSLDEQRGDEKRISTPQNARWRDLKWSVAYRKHNKAVKSWMSKACKGTEVTRLLR